MTTRVQTEAFVTPIRDPEVGGGGFRAPDITGGAREFKR
jgi:hypothetical protein